jgi:hypothetical protein
MEIADLFCNSNELPKGDYFALPVVVWDVLVAEAIIPETFFSNLILNFLQTGDKTIHDLHELTNLDESLVRYILEHDLRQQVTKGIDKWHVPEGNTKTETKIKKTRIVVLQSMLTGQLIPHPLINGELTSIDYQQIEKRISITGGTKGKPYNIRPFIVYPRLDGHGKYAPNISAEDIYCMWKEYQQIDCDIAMSDYDDVKSGYIEQPDKIISIERRDTDSDICNFLLVKINKISEGEAFQCIDMLEENCKIPMEFLTNELNVALEQNEQMGVFLGIKSIEVPITLQDRIQSRYPHFKDDIIIEICRFLALKDILADDADKSLDLSDAFLTRMQNMYESILRTKNTPFDDELKKISRKDEQERYYYLEGGLRMRNLNIDTITKKALTNDDVWRNMTRLKPSLKSLLIRHLLFYLYHPKNPLAWFAARLNQNRSLNEDLKLIIELVNTRNIYDHFNSKRDCIPYSYKNLYNRIEKQLDILHEAYK